MGSPRQGAQAPWRLRQRGYPARMLPERRLAEHRSGAKEGRHGAHADLHANYSRDACPVLI